MSDKPNKGFWKSIWHRCDILVAAIGAIFAMLPYLGLEPKDTNTWIKGLLKEFLGLLTTYKNWILLITCLLLLRWFYERRISKLKSIKQPEFLDVPIVVHEPKNIVLFVPRSNRIGFFWEKFEIEVIYSLSDNGFYCHIQSLNGEYDEVKQAKYIEDFPWDNVSGAIIAPAGPKVLPVIAARLREKRHIVLHDVVTDEWLAHFQNENQKAPSCVSIDNGKGGQLAADVMYNYLRTPIPKSRYTIWIIPGHKEHPHSKSRISNFRERWSFLTENVKFGSLDPGDWTADGCRASLEKRIKEHSGNKTPEVIDGIFACNDEMALAAAHHIDYLIMKAKPDEMTSLRNTIVVGFDATREAYIELRNDGSRFIATIDAKIREQAETVVSCTINCINTPEAREWIRISPTIVDRNIAMKGGMT